MRQSYLLHKKHNKANFDCGKSLLNQYLKIQAGQDVRRKLSACFVITEEDADVVIGYYTLSNFSIPNENLPENIRTKLPMAYAVIPVTLLGRLAVDIRCKGKGMGRWLLIDALKKAWYASHEIGSFAVVVDPLDEEAEIFYEKYGFIKLPDSGKMFIGMATLRTLFNS